MSENDVRCLFQHLKQAGPGDPAAPKTFCLPLLPSGPGGVHRVLLHRARPLVLAERRELSQSSIQYTSRSNRLCSNPTFSMDHLKY